MASGAFELIDETAGQVVLLVDSSGNVGVNGASGANILSIGGVGIIKSTSVAYDNTIITVAVAPAQGSITVPASSTGTVTTSLGTVCIPNVDQNGDVESIGTTSFIVRNNSGGSLSLRYNYW